MAVDMKAEMVSRIAQLVAAVAGVPGDDPDAHAAAERIVANIHIEAATIRHTQQFKAQQRKANAPDSQGS